MSIVNKVKSLGARATMGDEDVRSLLETDHNEAKDLAGQMCEAPQARTRMSAMLRLKSALTAHSRAEERVVYEALLAQRGDQESRDIANEGYVEHRLVDELLVKLAAGDAAGEVWMAQATVLKELLEHHIAEEQNETFADLGKHFSRDELALMGERFLQEKANVLRGVSGTAGRGPRSRKRAATAHKPVVHARNTAAKRRTPARKVAVRKRPMKKRR